MLKEFKQVIKNKNFRYLWASQILSQLTINIMNFVFLIRLYEMTGSALSTSFLWVAYSLPAILIGPFASATVDMIDRRKILIFTNLFQSLTVLICSFTHAGNIFVLFAVVFIYSLLNQFYVPAESASLPSVLSKDKLTQGNSLFFLTQQGSLVVGFGVAGLIYSLLGFDRTLLICALFLFIAFINTVFLPPITSGKVGSIFEASVSDFFDRIIGGYKFIKGERRVLTPFLLMIGFMVSVQVVIVAVPSIAQEVLRLPLSSAGIFILVPAGIGALTGITILPKLLAKNWRKKRVIDICLLLIGLFLLTFTYGIPFLPIGFRILASFICLIGLGLSFVGVVIPSQTFLQEMTPKELRGRVFGNLWFLVTAASVIPVIFSGSMIEILGIRSLLMILSIITIAGHFISSRYGDDFLNGN